MEREKRVSCCAMVTRPPEWIKNYPCARWAVVSRDGKGYCKQHDPHNARQRDIKKHIQEQQIAQNTLSRDTAIKLVEAAADLLQYGYPMKKEETFRVIEAAKRELGI